MCLHLLRESTLPPIECDWECCCASGKRFSRALNIAANRNAAFTLLCISGYALQCIRSALCLPFFSKNTLPSAECDWECCCSSGRRFREHEHCSKLKRCKLLCRAFLALYALHSLRIVCHSPGGTHCRLLSVTGSAAVFSGRRFCEHWTLQQTEVQRSLLMCISGSALHCIRSTVCHSSGRDTLPFTECYWQCCFFFREAVLRALELQQTEMQRLF